MPSWSILFLAFFGVLFSLAAADDVLETDGFTSCMNNTDIEVQKVKIQFDRSTNKIFYDLAGTSKSVQTVMANLEISAYGKEIKNMSFDPCTPNKVEQLCPVPKGTFAARGEWTIPQEYASQIPSIAYTIPNLDGESKIELKSTSGPNKDKNIACYSAHVSNTKSFAVPAVSWVAAGIAAGALVVSAIGAVGAAAAGGGAVGAPTPSPTFTEVIFYFQGIATTGMMSADLPPVYRSFSQNFGFSAGLIGWEPLQNSIDNFRSSTGGNLTDDSVQSLKNTTLVYNKPDNGSPNKKRSVDAFGSFFENAFLAVRDNSLTTSINGTDSTVGGGKPAQNDTKPADNKEQKYVNGITAFANKLAIPDGNTFMTALLIFAIILAAIIAGILLFKVILEAWSLIGNFPKSLTSFRKNYWWLIAKTITNLILLLYGVWVLYCVFQLRLNDSWGARVLAAVTLAIFTAVLVGFAVRIFMMAHKFKKAAGNTQMLYMDKETWRKYSIFYDSFKKGYWWMFVPAIIFMFAKGVILAGANGKTSNHSLAQTAALLIVDSIMLLVLLFLRPYELKSGQWINTVIAVVRVISVVCVLVFVEKLGFAQTTKTVTGVVLIVVQASMTAVLGILIAINAIINCVRMNPHRRARKEAEKNRDVDTLTPLDARNSLLMGPMEKKGGSVSEVSVFHQRGRSQNGYDMMPLRDESRDGLLTSHSRDRSSSRQPMLPNLDAPYRDRERSISPVGPRQPQLPDLDYRGGRAGPPGMAM